MTNLDSIFKSRDITLPTKVRPVKATQSKPVLCCVYAQSLQSGPTLCNPMDCSPPGSFVHGISQVGILEWVAISFSNA